jgi:hypothetical protein
VAETLTSVRRTLIEALSARRYRDADRLLSALEDEANAALAEGELERIVSTRGRMSRLRRVAAGADPDWPGVQRMLTLDRALGSAVTGLQLALRRGQRLPVPERVAAAGRGRAGTPTVRARVLAALDDKPRRPVELLSRTGIGKRQLQRALGELVASGKARAVHSAADDDRASFYQRVT